MPPPRPPLSTSPPSDRYELLRQKHEALGLPFPETVYWWSDSAALGSPFITIFECPMSAAERAGLYLWYFVFGFGTFGMWLFLELHGPTDQRDDAEAESRMSAFRFRWCLLVTGLGGIMLFGAACINLDKDLKRKYPLTKNMVGIISFVLMVRQLRHYFGTIFHTSMHCRPTCACDVLYSVLDMVSRLVGC